MKKALLVILTAIILFSLVAIAVSAESDIGSDEGNDATSVVPYESEGMEAKKLEWLYYVIGFTTVALVIGAAVFISKKR